jgi:hypothetical protein
MTKMRAASDTYAESRIVAACPRTKCAVLATVHGGVVRSSIRTTWTLGRVLWFGVAVVFVAEGLHHSFTRCAPLSAGCGAAKRAGPVRSFPLTFSL